MLSVKQRSIKYHILSLWYDSTWEWIQVSRAIGEHSTYLANDPDYGQWAGTLVSFVILKFSNDIVKNNGTS